MTKRSEMNEKQTQKIKKNAGAKPIWQRRWLQIILSLAVLFGCVLLLLPFAIRYYLQNWLLENGADTASITKVELNIFTGRAALKGVDVQRGGRTVLTDSSLFVDIGLRDLFSKRALVQKATMTDLVLDIEQSGETIRIGSFSPAPSNQATSSAPPSPEPDKNSPPWIVLAENIDITNVSLHYRSDKGLDLVLLIEEAHIVGFNTDPHGNPATLNLRGSVNGSPIALNLDHLRVAPFLEIDGKIDLQEFQLAILAEFLKSSLTSFTGRATVLGDAKFSLSEEETKVVFAGQLGVKDADIGGGSWGTSGTIGFDGKTSYSMAQDTQDILVDGDLSAGNFHFGMKSPALHVDNPAILISGKTSVTLAEQVLIASNASIDLGATEYGMENLKAEVKKSDWVGDIHLETGSGEKGLRLRLDGELSFASPLYQMGAEAKSLHVKNESLSYRGKFEFGGSTANTAAYIRSNGILAGQNTEYFSPGLAFNLGQLELTGKMDLTLGEELSSNYDGLLSMDENSLKIADIDLQTGLLSWQGKVEYAQKNQAPFIGLQGNLASKGLEVNLITQELRIHQQTLGGTFDCTINPAENFRFDGSADLAAESLAISQKDQDLFKLVRLAVNGINGPETGGIGVKDLLAEGLSLPASTTMPIAADIRSIELNNFTSPDLSAAQLQQIIINQPLVQDPKTGKVLARFETLSAGPLTMDKNLQVSLPELLAQDGKFLVDKSDRPQMQLKIIKISQSGFSKDDGLTIDVVELDSLWADLLREKSTEQKPTPQQQIKQTQKDQKKLQTEALQPENSIPQKGIPVKIGLVSLTGKSGFSYNDTSLTEPFKTQFHAESAEISNIDLNSPDAFLDYVLHGAFDKYAALSLVGKCAPLAEDLQLNQKLQLNNYPMQNISPYTIETIGTKFVSGRLSATSDLALKGETIKMKNNFIIREVDSQTADGELAAKLNNKLPVPLDLALILLKGTDDTIDLDIPISGQLSHMRYGLGDIIFTAFTKAITLGVTPYLAYTALGPAGAAVLVGAKVGEKLLATHLPSLYFDNGATELSQKNLEKLKKVGDTLTDKSETGYSICATVSPLELRTPVDTRQSPLSDEQRKELLALGEKRSLTVLGYLQNNFSVKKGQLFLCNPAIDSKPDGKSKIEFKK